MKATHPTPLSPRLHARLSTYASLAGIALAGPALVAPDASATIITSGPVNIVVPPTFAGIYNNFVTGTASTTATTGYDFDPYASGGNLSFFFPSTGPAGGVSSGGVFLDLNPGVVIDSSSTFLGGANSTAAALANYRTTDTEYLGVRFLNETTGVLNYGYVHFQTTAVTGFPATILDYAYENTGAGIAVPGIPEPATTTALGLGALALGASTVRRWRRSRPVA